MYLKAGTLGPMSVERGCCSKLAKPRNFKPRSFLPSVYSLTQQIVLKHLVKDIKPLAIHRALFHQFVTQPRMFGPFQEAELLLLRACLRQRSPLPDPFEAHTPPCCCPLLPSLHSLNTLPPDLVFLSTTTLDDLNVHPSNPLVFLGFVILFCLQWSSLTSCSHCKVTPWIVLHRELALLISLIQASWSQASIFSPSQAACSTTPSRSELSSDCPLGCLLSSQHCVLPSRPYLFSLSTVGPFFNNSILIIIQLLSFVLVRLIWQNSKLSLFSARLYLGIRVLRGRATEIKPQEANFQCRSRSPTSWGTTEWCEGPNTSGHFTLHNNCFKTWIFNHLPWSQISEKTKACIRTSLSFLLG